MLAEAQLLRDAGRQARADFSVVHGQIQGLDVSLLGIFIPLCCAYSVSEPSVLSAVIFPGLHISSLDQRMQDTVSILKRVSQALARVAGTLWP